MSVHRFLLAGAAWLAVGGVSAATLRGNVVADNGQPVAGALVSVTDRRGISDTVYSDAQGRFTLDTRLPGRLALQVRKRYHADATRSLAPAALGKPLAIQLKALTDPQQLSADHPSLSHFSRIAFDTDPAAPFSRANLSRDCLTCHSVGNAYTRFPRPAQAWTPTLQRMLGHIGQPDASRIPELAERLAKAFDGTPVTSRPEVPTDALLATAQIHRWPLKGAALPHDAEIHHTNGRAYITDMFAGALIELDLASGRMSRYQDKVEDGSPPGGWFTKNKLPPPYGLMIPHAPHSLAQATNGRYYLTDSIGSTLVEFDPATKRFRHHDIPGVAVYPHTIRAAADGSVWFTIIASNQVARFDPASGAMKVIQLPTSPNKATLLGGPAPYGIDIHPKDGSVWYAKLSADKLGRIDPVTFEVKEFDSPVRGPRRHRFDAEGRLWLAGFADGAIARIDVATMAAKVYPLPQYAKGEVPAPYALGVHPQTQEVWVNDSMMDLVWRFLPKEERFVAYPLPLKGTYTRDFVFTKAGWACTTNNPMPAAALEGGTPELICIDAGAAPATRTSLAAPSASLATSSSGVTQ